MRNVDMMCMLRTASPLGTMFFVVAWMKMGDPERERDGTTTKEMMAGTIPRAVVEKKVGVAGAASVGARDQSAKGIDLHVQMRGTRVLVGTGPAYI
jgi:hypothetical protein